MSGPDYSRHAQTARQVAAWIKAYGVSPTGVELAAVMGTSTMTAIQRMHNAERHGFLRLIRTRRNRRYEPVWELLPGYLQEARPMSVPRRRLRRGTRRPLQPWACPCDEGGN